MFPRSVLLGALLFSAGVTWLALSPSCNRRPRETVVDQARKAGVLILGNGAEPLDLDPQVVTGIPEMRILDALYEGLVDHEPHGLGLAPGVAERWESTPDGRVWTFHLQPNAKWSNGDALTATDFVRSYERQLHPEFAGDYAYLFSIVAGADEYHSGKLKDFSRVGFRAVDPQTLEIRLTRPVPYFLQLLTYTCWRPVHLPSIEATGGKRRKGTGWTKPGKLVGNGPFQLERWEHNKLIRVVPNPHYWDAKTVILRGIEFVPVENVETEERMFRSGQLHKTAELPVGKVLSYRRYHPEWLRIDPLLGVYFFRFNTTKPPFNDVRVRRAFSLALDRRALVDRILQAGQQPALSFTPPETGGFRTEVALQPSLERARELLSDAGYPRGENFPEVELLYNTSENHQKIAEAVQEMWRAQLGVKIELRNEEWKVYLESAKQKKYDLCRAGWVAIYNDPSQFLEIFTSASGNNHTGWTHPGYDQRFRDSQETMDRGQREQVFNELEALLEHEAPIAPLYFYTRCYLLDPKVQGWHATLLDKHPYKHVWFAKE